MMMMPMRIMKRMIMLKRRMMMKMKRRVVKCLAALTWDSDSPQQPTLGILPERYLCPWWS